MKNLTSRAQKAIVTKNKIYECGIQLIKEYGFDEVTIEKIAKEAGVSVGTYYYYFESKLELFRETFNRADEYFITQVSESLKGLGTKQKILMFFDKYALFNLKDGIKMIKRLYTSENKLFTVEGRQMQKLFTMIIIEGKDSRCISIDKTSEELTSIFFMVARGVVFEWCLHDGNIELREVMKSAIETVIRGIL